MNERVFHIPVQCIVKLYQDNNLQSYEMKADSPFIHIWTNTSQ